MNATDCILSLHSKLDLQSVLRIHSYFISKTDCASPGLQFSPAVQVMGNWYGKLTLIAVKDNRTFNLHKETEVPLKNGRASHYPQQIRFECELIPNETQDKLS